MNSESYQILGTGYLNYKQLLGLWLNKEAVPKNKARKLFDLAKDFANNNQVLAKYTKERNSTLHFFVLLKGDCEEEVGNLEFVISNESHMNAKKVLSTINRYENKDKVNLLLSLPKRFYKNVKYGHEYRSLLTEYLNNEIYKKCVLMKNKKGDVNNEN